MTAPAPYERDRIRAAMARILAGAPERSNGALTIVTVAIEQAFPATRSPCAASKIGVTWPELGFTRRGDTPLITPRDDGFSHTGRRPTTSRTGCVSMSGGRWRRDCKHRTNR